METHRKLEKLVRKAAQNPQARPKHRQKLERAHDVMVEDQLREIHEEEERAQRRRMMRRYYG